RAAETKSAETKSVETKSVETQSDAHDSAPGSHDKPAPSRSRAPEQPATTADPKPTSATAQAGSAGPHRDLTVRDISLTAASPVSISRPAISKPSSSPAPIADPAPVSLEPETIRPNPVSEVTDLSVSIPISRADGPGEQNVAIRMMQRGAEIHVSVR